MKHLLLPALLLTTTCTFAQSTAEELAASATTDLARLNEHFAGAVKFRVDKHQRLVADYMNGGSVYRTDIAHFDFLDAGTCAFDQEEKLLVIQCQDPRSKCIDKEVRKTGTVSPTGRMNLPLPAHDPTGTKARELLVKLVETKQNEELTRLAETNTRTERSK